MKKPTLKSNRRFKQSNNPELTLFGAIPAVYNTGVVKTLNMDRAREIFGAAFLALSFLSGCAGQDADLSEAQKAGTTDCSREYLASFDFSENINGALKAIEPAAWQRVADILLGHRNTVIEHRQAAFSLDTSAFEEVILRDDTTSVQSPTSASGMEMRVKMHIQTSLQQVLSSPPVKALQIIDVTVDWPDAGQAESAVEHHVRALYSRTLDVVDGNAEQAFDVDFNLRKLDIVVPETITLTQPESVSHRPAVADLINGYNSLCRDPTEFNRQERLARESNDHLSFSVPPWGLFFRDASHLRGLEFFPSSRNLRDRNGVALPIETFGYVPLPAPHVTHIRLGHFYGELSSRYFPAASVLRAHFSSAHVSIEPIIPISEK